MDFQNLHQHNVSVNKIVALTLNAVRPFVAIEQIVAQAENNDKKGRNQIGCIVVFTFEDGKHKLGPIGVAQSEGLVLLCGLTILNVTGTEVSQAFFEAAVDKEVIGVPFTANSENLSHTSTRIKHLCFKKTPEQQKAEYGLTTLLRKFSKTRSMVAQPIERSPVLQVKAPSTAGSHTQAACGRKW